MASAFFNNLLDLAPAYGPAFCCRASSRLFLVEALAALYTEQHNGSHKALYFSHKEDDEACDFAQFDFCFGAIPLDTMFAVSHVTVTKQTGEAAMVYVLEFLATKADGTSRTIEIAKQRAKTNSLIDEKANVLMKDAAFRQGRPDLCVIKDQMSQVHDQVAG